VVVAATAVRGNRRRFVTAAAVTALAAAIAGEYLLRIPGFPRYPGLDQAAEPLAFLREFLTVGFPGLFWRSIYLNAGVLAAALVLLTLRFARRNRLPVTAPEAALLASTGLWLAWALAGIYHYGRLDYFNQWGRFVLPVYPFVCVLAVRHARVHRTGPSRPAASLAARRTGQAAAVALLALVLLLTPWRRMARFAVWRGRAASGRPFLSAEAKHAAVYGSWHRTVTYVNDLFRAAGGGRVLTEDVRIHYLEPLAYEAFGVPEDVRSIPEFLRWARANDVRWVVRGLRRRDFATSDRKRGTVIHAFLRSPHARLRARIGSFQVFTVEPRVDPRVSRADGERSGRSAGVSSVLRGRTPCSGRTGISESRRSSPNRSSDRGSPQNPIPSGRISDCSIAPRSRGTSTVPTRRSTFLQSLRWRSRYTS